MKRQHVRLASVAQSLNQFQFGISNRTFDSVRRPGNAGTHARQDKRVARLEEVDVGIPQRIVGIENQVEGFTRIGIHQYTSLSTTIGRRNPLCRSAPS